MKAVCRKSWTWTRNTGGNSAEENPKLPVSVTGASFALAIGVVFAYVLSVSCMSHYLKSGGLRNSVTRLIVTDT